VETLVGDGRLRNELAAVVAAAIAAVRPERLVADRIALVAGEVLLDGRPLDPPLTVGRGRIAVVGGGKAAAGMAAGLAGALTAGGIAAERITGLVSVPEGSGRRLPGVEVRETRPAAENLPTPAAVAATREMLALVATLGPDDLAIALVSGGGSALLAAPRAGVLLDDKLTVTRFLSAAGAEITALNLVRQAASDVKGGGLARACTAGRLLVLVLSDVTGDPLEFIASGPCMPVAAPAAAALAVLERFGATPAAPRLTAVLQAEAARAGHGNASAVVSATGSSASASWTTLRGCRVDHLLLGTNATAVEAAAGAAKRLGDTVTIRPAAPRASETADEVGRRLADEGLVMAAAAAADGRARALIEGGEAIVRLPADHGRGGRNQQTVVAALAEASHSGAWPPGLLVASLGTDGEDGPTPAAGGLADRGVATKVQELGLDAAAAVARCDSLPLLEAAGGLIVTGPSGTNVADVRLVLARP
jgi:hydroxypyruvate reductase